MMKMGMIPKNVWEILLLISMMIAIIMMMANCIVMMMHNDTTQKATTHNLWPKSRAQLYARIQNSFHAQMHVRLSRQPLTKNKRDGMACVRQR